MRHDVVVLVLVPWFFLGPSSSAQAGALPANPAAGFDAWATAKPDAQLATCGRPRVTKTREAPFDPAELAQMREQGKLVTIDALTGKPLFTHITDYLPAGWGRNAGASEPTDSFGQPIVNEKPGLPGWSERDVAALRRAIADALEPSGDESAAGRTERQLRLGNYLGQALVRGIDVSDLVLLDGEEVTPAVAAEAIDQLRFAESLAALHAEDGGYEYRPSVYDDGVVAFVEAHGGSLPEILSSAAAPRTKAAPSGCYTQSTFSRGMTLLTGATEIWRLEAKDDDQADVPIGFNYSFYGCPDSALPDNHNRNVRVSTNGYVTFYEQGGGAADGTDYTNDSIPAETDPDEYIAPYWDDLRIQPPNVLNAVDKVSYRTEGADGSRVFTVEWLSMTHVGGDPTKGRDFQVKLFEADGNVELHFGNLDVDDTESATVGMESALGGSGDCGPNCTGNNTGATILSNYRFAPQRPANDSCLSPICLGDDAPSFTGNTFGATGHLGCNENDFSNDIHDVWFWYHSPNNRTVYFDTCGSGFDTTLAAYDSCGGAQLDCSDDSCGPQSSIEVFMGTGEDVYVGVAGYQGLQGTYTITTGWMQIGNPLGSDTCATAQTLTGSAVQTTANNTGCVDESSCGGTQDSIDEWFAWEAPVSGPVSFTTCHPETTFNTTLAIFDACGGTELACNDNAPGKTCSTLTTTVVAGQTYYLRLAGYNRSYGPYKLTNDVLFADGFESGNVSAWSSSIP